MMRKYYNTYSDLPKWKAVWKSLAFADVYTCAPPRLFIPVMCLLQFCVFVHYRISGKIRFSKLHFLNVGPPKDITVGPPKEDIFFDPIYVFCYDEQL